MMVRAGDDIYRMADLKGRKIGLSKSLNNRRCDWWRITEEQGIELMLRLSGMTRKNVEIVVAFMKGIIKVGRWCNEHTHAAAAILDKATFYCDVEDTYRNIVDVDMVPSLSPQNLAAVEVGKDFMLGHGYMKHDFDVHEWAAPEFLQQAAKELLEERWTTVTAAKLPEATALRLG